MKKILLLILFFCFLNQKNYGQNAYYIATTFNQLSEINDGLVRHYIYNGLVKDLTLDNRYNGLSDLSDFRTNQFNAHINYENLLYQIEVNKIIENAIQNNIQSKVKFWSTYIEHIESGSNIKTGIQCTDDNIVQAIYENNSITYQELCNCLNDSIAKAALRGLYADRVRTMDEERSKDVGNSANNFLSGFGNLSNVNFTSMLVDATSQFLVERVQKELSIAFFDNFRKKMDSIPELKAFFPSTYNLLKSLLDFKEPSLGKAWVDAFSSDLMLLPKNFEAFVRSSDKPIYQALKNQPEFQYFALAYHIAEKIIEGSNAADLITYLGGYIESIDGANSINDNIKNALKITYLISKNIRYIPNAESSKIPQIWVHPSDLLQMDTRAKRFFIGLIYQEGKDAFNSVLIDTTDESTNKKVESFLTKLNSFLVICENIQSQHQKLEKILKDSTATHSQHLSAYLDYAEVAFQIIDFGFSLNTHSNAVTDYNTKYKPLMKGVLDLINGINEKDYALVFVQGLNIVTKLMDLVLVDKNLLNNTDLINGIKKINSTIDSTDAIGLINNMLNGPYISDNILKTLRNAIKANSLITSIKDIAKKCNLDSIEFLIKSKADTLAIKKHCTNCSDSIVNSIKHAIANGYPKLIDSIAKIYHLDSILIHDLINFDENNSLITYIYNALNANTSEVKKLREILEQVAFYGGFVVDIVTADSTMKMKRILNKYAAPIGSYKIKRNSIFSVDLNAYPGLYAGYEYTPLGKSSNTQHGFAYGVTAPIGFSINWGTVKNASVNKVSDLKQEYYQNSKNKWKKTGGSSHSIFFSVVDIGAAFSYRWTNDTIHGFPDSLRIEQIFSPGLHYVHGFKNSPISLMVGIQYTPLLRGIKENNAVISEFNAWRFGISLTVDIPVFNLYRNKRREKYK